MVECNMPLLGIYMPQRSFHAREICFREEDDFYAVSLDFDLFAEGKTKEEAMQRLREATMGYLLMCVQENEPDTEVYRPAPKKYLDMFYYYLEEAKSRESHQNKRKTKYHKKIFSIELNDYDNILA